MVSITEKMSRFYGLKTQDAQQKIRLAFSFVERNYLKVSLFTSFRWLYLSSTCQCHQRVFQELMFCFFLWAFLWYSLYENQQSEHFIDCPCIACRVLLFNKLSLCLHMVRKRSISVIRT